VTSDQSYQGGEMDFKAQLTAIRGGKRQSRRDLYSRLLHRGRFDRTPGRQLGITAPLLGGDGWDSSKLSEIGGAAV